MGIVIYSVIHSLQKRVLYSKINKRLRLHRLTNYPTCRYIIEYILYINYLHQFITTHKMLSFFRTGGHVTIKWQFQQIVSFRHFLHFLKISSLHFLFNKLYAFFYHSNIFPQLFDQSKHHILSNQLLYREISLLKKPELNL